MANTVRTLSFELRIIDSVEDCETADGAQGAGKAYRSVEARPSVDGMPLHDGYVFDVSPLIGYGLRNASTDLYTCSCGIAGCAGIHDEVELQVSDDAMVWLFPEVPFRKTLPAALFPANQPLAVRFDREQYRQALQSLEAQLLALAADGGTPVILAPTTYPDFSKSLADSFAASRKWADRVLERQAQRQALFGVFYDQEVLIRFPNGAQRLMSIVHLAQNLSYDEFAVSGRDQDEILSGSILPSWHADTANLFAAVRSLSWEEADGMLFRTPGDLAPGSVGADEWAHVELALFKPAEA